MIFVDKNMSADTVWNQYVVVMFFKLLTKDAPYITQMGDIWDVLCGFLVQPIHYRPVWNTMLY